MVNTIVQICGDILNICDAGRISFEEYHLTEDTTRQINFSFKSCGNLIHQGVTLDICLFD